MQYDLTDFRVVANIAEEANLTRGAARSFLSVAATSHRVRNLEDALRVKLFERSAQGVSLTEAGKAYLAHAYRVLGQLEHLTSDLQPFGAGVTGSLRIQANTTAITEFLPPVFSEFLRAHRDVQVDLRERLSDDAVRAVREGSADLAIISGSVPVDDLEVQRFASSRLVAVAPVGHEILSRTRVAFAELLEHEFVALLDGCATQQFLRHMALKQHRRIKVRVQVAGFDALCRMVEAGVGVGVVPEVAVIRLNLYQTLGVRELADPWALREYRLCAKCFDALPPFAQSFVQTMLDRYRR